MLSRNGENLPTGPAPGQPPTSSLVSFFHLEIETVMTCSWEPLWLQLVAGMSNADRWRSQISWAGDRKTNMPLSQLQIQLGSRFSGTPGQLSCHQAEKVPPKTQRPTGCTHSHSQQHAVLGLVGQGPAFHQFHSSFSPIKVWHRRTLLGSRQPLSLCSHMPFPL